MTSRTFFATLEHLHEMMEWIHAETSFLNAEASLKVALAAEEAIVNIISHAYAHKGGEIEIQVQRDAKNGVHISFVDRGAFFDPLSKEEAKKPSSLEEQAVGGLGISLMRKCVDEVLYKKENDRNVLTLIKRVY